MLPSISIYHEIDSAVSNKLFLLTDLVMMILMMMTTAFIRLFVSLLSVVIIDQIKLRGEVQTLKQTGAKNARLLEIR
jgi:hypothetical protein